MSKKSQPAAKKVKALKVDILLGDQVMDSLTGYKGIAVSRSEWLNRDAQIGIQSQDLTKEGQIRSVEWVSEKQVVVVKQNAYSAFDKTADSDSI